MFIFAPDMKVILITGASSGIGYAAAQMLARKGCKVYGAARRVEKIEPLRSEGVIPLKLDVTDAAACHACVAQIVAAEGRLDALVNNAGYGHFGAIENVPDEQARYQMEVNVFAMAELTRAVLPVMREQGSGRIVNISSVAGRSVLYFGGWYHVSKYAVEAFSDALRIETKPFGIDVVMIEPGATRTEWGNIAASHLEETSRGTVYEQAASREAALFRYAFSLKLLSPPESIAKAIVKAVLRRRPRARYVVGFGSRTLLVLHALLPTRWWDALMRGAGHLTK